MSYATADAFLSFHFKCLAPFLAPVDWLSLSRCCRYFHYNCDTKHTMFEKYRDAVLEHLSCEGDLFAEHLFSILRDQNGTISGSFALCMFTGDDFFKDVDVFYEPSESIIPPTISMPKGFKSFLHPSRRSHNYYHAVPYIADVTDYTSAATGKKYQMIEIDHEYDETTKVILEDDTLGEEEKKQKINKLQRKEKSQSEIEHVRCVIFDNFDFDFCKILFTPQSLEIYDADSMMERKTAYNIKPRIDRLLHPENGAFLLKKLKARIEKYTERNFVIEVGDLLQPFELIQKVFEFCNDAESFTFKENRKRRQEEKLLLEKESKRQKTQEELDEEAKRKKQLEEQIVEKWLSEPVKYTNDGRYSHIVCEMNSFHLSPSDIFQLTGLASYHIYNVLCYADENKLIDRLFDKNKIPFDWIQDLKKSIEQYYGSMMPHVNIQSIFMHYFWKYICQTWPCHYKVLEIFPNKSDEKLVPVPESNKQQIEEMQNALNIMVDEFTEPDSIVVSPHVNPSQSGEPGDSHIALSEPNIVHIVAV